LHSISNKNDGTNLKLLFLKKELYLNYYTIINRT